MTYTNTQYCNDQNNSLTGIRVEINGVASFVPIAPGNTDYDKIMALVVAGQLNIEDASLPLPAPVPTSITNFQARALLMQMPGSAEGRTLFQDVDETLQQLGGVAYQAWEYTTIFPRDSELIATMATQFNLTNTQLDEMFIAASQISV